MLMIVLCVPGSLAAAEKRRKKRAPQQADSAGATAPPEPPEDGTQQAAPAPFINAHGGLDLDILLEGYGGTSEFFESTWGVAPAVLNPAHEEGDPTIQDRLYLGWRTVETLLSYVPYKTAVFFAAFSHKMCIVDHVCLKKRAGCSLP